MTSIKDAEQRRLAIDPEQSFIVQAPAGSGKTELLIQRYLRLLATVEQPEEIVCITFTRKAAAEMRFRILAALKQAATGIAPQEAHRQLTYRLATEVLAHSKEKNWDILHESPRMAIQTFDAYCAAVARRAPVTSGLGAMPELTQDPYAYYHEAARSTITDIDNPESQEHIGRVLAFLDNDAYKMQSLIAGMLARRDQWIRHVFCVGDRTSRQILEDAFALYRYIAMNRVTSLIPEALKPAWLSLARYGAGELSASSQQSLVCNCLDVDVFPDHQDEFAEIWEGLIEIVLTRTGSWRRRIDKSIGFYAVDKKEGPELSALRKQRKQELSDLIASLADIPGLESGLNAVRDLPESRYTESEWQIISSIMEVLKRAILNLKVNMARDGITDYQEILLAASAALGEPDEPADLLLFLDHRISHILIDEFQDTSISQYEFLLRLTAGWQENNGRSLFLVGDPMQSIYRFRQADVGLFVRAQLSGIGHIQLRPLTLEINFRSTDGIIDWVNQCFNRIMPERSDMQTGAVSYSASAAIRQNAQHEAVKYLACVDTSTNGEVNQIVTAIEDIRQSNSDDSIAILVRSKNHLPDILRGLKNAAIPYKAVDIEKLVERQTILDLVSLTAAVFNLYDKVSWLATLRAPWCGLSLAELHTVVTAGQGDCVPEQLHDPEIHHALASGNSCYSSFVKSLDEALEKRSAKSLRRLIQGLWLSLGGPACLRDDDEISDVEVFWHVLDEMEHSKVIPNRANLEHSLERFFASATENAANPVAVMSIHKSKGLEFDHVILPAVNKASPNPEDPLVLWDDVVHESTGTTGIDNLMLAPLSARFTEQSKKYELLKKLSNAKENNEIVRLLYVAATRARNTLLITGTFSQNDDTLKTSHHSFARLLVNDPALAIIETDSATDISTTATDRSLKRLQKGWQMPQSRPVPVANMDEQSPDTQNSTAEIEFDWATEIAIHVGTITHYLLNRISSGNHELDKIDVMAYTDEINTALKNNGVPANNIEQATKRVLAAIRNTLTDKTGRWILSNEHQSTASEYGLTGVIETKLINVIIDRTFVDADNVRWIIDYKTSRHEGSGLEQFLENEKIRYRDQLETYAALMSGMDNRKIIKALYFPLLQKFVAWN